MSTKTKAHLNNQRPLPAGAEAQVAMQMVTFDTGIWQGSKAWAVTQLG